MKQFYMKLTVAAYSDRITTVLRIRLKPEVCT